MPPNLPRLPGSLKPWNYRKIGRPLPAPLHVARLMNPTSPGGADSSEPKAPPTGGPAPVATGTPAGDQGGRGGGDDGGPAPASASPSAATATERVLRRTRFTSELQVRPDDIDMFQHVHSSRYLDYVLTARFDQMERCYGMGMEKFLEIGLGWFQRSAHVEYKRPLKLGDRFTVTTWIQEVVRDTVRVEFVIRRADNNKVSCDGHCDYTLVSLATGRGEVIPDWIAEKYVV